MTSDLALTDLAKENEEHEVGSERILLIHELCTDEQREKNATLVVFVASFISVLINSNKCLKPADVCNVLVYSPQSPVSPVTPS